MATIEADIVEQGNGYPSVGEYVQDDDRLYRVVRDGSRITTGRPGDGDTCHGYLLEPADWDDCEEDDVHPCAVISAK